MQTVLLKNTLTQKKWKHLLFYIPLNLYTNVARIYPVLPTWIRKIGFLKPYKHRNGKKIHKQIDSSFVKTPNTAHLLCDRHYTRSRHSLPPTSFRFVFLLLYIRTSDKKKTSFHLHISLPDISLFPLHLRLFYLNHSPNIRCMDSFTIFGLHTLHAPDARILFFFLFNNNNNTKNVHTMLFCARFENQPNERKKIKKQNKQYNTPKF